LRWAADVAPGICTAEPPVPSEAELDADPAAGLRWEQEVLLRARSCRSALTRVCGWHRERGLQLPAGVTCGDVTTNGIESVFAVLKRGLHGVYHHASPKHLHRYVGEFAFRLGDGDVSRHTMDRLASLFAACIGQRLTYKELIA